MARKKADAEGKSIDSIFAQKMSSAKEKFGDNLYINGEEGSRIFCIECPFALKYILQMSGFPLGRFISVVGPPESCKSAMGYELGRIHRVCNGGYSLTETENKDSTTLRKSIAGYDDRRSSVVYVSSIEEWQAALKYQTDTVKAAMDDFSPPRSVPWAFIIDSVNGVNTQKVSDDIHDTGAAKIGYGHGANIISTFMKDMPHFLDDYPFSIVGISHEKPQPDQYGHLTKRNIPGGYAIMFHTSICIEMKSIGIKQGERKDPTYERFKQLQVQVIKNSMAQHTAKPFRVEMVWRFVPMDPTNPNGPVLQRTFFDWNTAMIEHLLEPEGSAEIKAKIKSIVDLRPTRKGKFLWSNALGIPDSAPVSYRKAGKMLDDRKDLQEALYPYLGIQKTFMFESGTDIRTQRQDCLKNIMQMKGDIYGFDPLEYDSLSAGESALENDPNMVGDYAGD